MMRILRKLVVLALAAVGAAILLDRLMQMEGEAYVPRGHASRYL